MDLVYIRKKVAVIGSGIAGLTSPWLLRKYDVTLFESALKVGMGAHAFEIEQQGDKERVIYLCVFLLVSIIIIC